MHVVVNAHEEKNADVKGFGVLFSILCKCLYNICIIYKSKRNMILCGRYLHILSINEGVKK